MNQRLAAFVSICFVVAQAHIFDNEVHALVPEQDPLGEVLSAVETGANMCAWPDTAQIKRDPFTNDGKRSTEKFDFKVHVLKRPVPEKGTADTYSIEATLVDDGYMWVYNHKSVEEIGMTELRAAFELWVQSKQPTVDRPALKAVASAYLKNVLSLRIRDTLNKMTDNEWSIPISFDSEEAAAIWKAADGAAVRLDDPNSMVPRSTTLKGSLLPILHVDLFYSGESSKKIMQKALEMGYRVLNVWLLISDRAVKSPLAMCQTNYEWGWYVDYASRGYKGVVDTYVGELKGHDGISTLDISPMRVGDFALFDSIRTPHAGADIENVDPEDWVEDGIEDELPRDRFSIDFRVLVKQLDVGEFGRV